MRPYTKTKQFGLLVLVLCLTAFTSRGATFSPEGKAAALVSATFTVTSTGDAGDDDVDDGVCATSGGVCTLRAAIMQANKLGGAHTIAFALGAGDGMSAAEFVGLHEGCTERAYAARCGTDAVVYVIVYRITRGGDGEGR